MSECPKVHFVTLRFIYGLFQTSIDQMSILYAVVFTLLFVLTNIQHCSCLFLANQHSSVFSPELVERPFYQNQHLSGQRILLPGIIVI